MSRKPANDETLLSLLGSSLGLISKLAENKKEVLELETRITNVNEKKFTRMLHLLSENLGESYTVTDEVAADDRTEKILFRTDSREGKGYWLKKTVLLKDDVSKQQLRLSLAKEEKIALGVGSVLGQYSSVGGLPVKNKILITRQKTRYSFPIDNAIVDISTVITFPPSSSPAKEGREGKKTYEIEIEGQDIKSKDFSENYLRSVHNVYSTYHGFYTDVSFSADYIDDVLNSVSGALAKFNTDKIVDISFKTLTWKNMENFYLSWKTDGYRAKLFPYVLGGNIHIVAYVSDGRLISLGKLGKSEIRNWDFVLDGEYYDKGSVGPSFYAFDALEVDKKSFMNEEDYKKRYDMIKVCADRIKSAAKGGEEINLFIKDIRLVRKDSFFADVKKFINQKQPDFENDGLVFTKEKHVPFTYIRGKPNTKYPQNIAGYKWKPAEKLTLDFEVKSSEKDLFFMDRGSRQSLKENYPNFSRVEDQKLGEGIYEFLWVEKVGWKKIRSRPDKEYPNSRTAVDSIINLIQDPISLPTLTGDNIRLVRKYHNRIKRDIIDDISAFLQKKKSSTLVDIGSGRGGDLDKWKKAGFSVIAIEPDKINYNEFEKRLATMDSSFQRKVTLIKSKAEDALNKEQEKYYAASAMLSLSFFWESKENLQQLADMVNSYIRPGGRLYFLTIDGEKLENYPSNEFKMSDVDMKINKGKKEVVIKIDETIVRTQREHFVFVEELAKLLNGTVEERKEANEEKLLSDKQKTFTSFYTYGYISVGNKVSATIRKNSLNSVFIEDEKLPATARKASPKKEVKSPVKADPTPVPVRKSPVKADPMPIPVPVRKSPVKADPTPMPIPVPVRKSPVKKVEEKKILKEVTRLTDDGTQEIQQLDKDIYRVSAIADGSCFIHCVLKAFNDEYANSTSYTEKQKMAGKLRRELANNLFIKPAGSKYINYFHTQMFAIFSNVMLEAKKILPEMDTSLFSIAEDLDSDIWLAEKHFPYILSVLGFNVIFVRVYETGKLQHLTTQYVKKGGKFLVIANVSNNSHYELICYGKDKQITFDYTHPFISSLDSKLSSREILKTNYDEKEVENIFTNYIWTITKHPDLAIRTKTNNFFKLYCLFKKDGKTLVFDTYFYNICKGK